MKIRIFLCSLLVVLLFVGIGAIIFLYEKFSYPLKYVENINSASTEFNVNPDIIASIINSESHFNERAISNKGAIGLMQILPSTAKWVAEKMNLDDDIKSNLFNSQSGNDLLFDSEINIKIGTYYFAYLINKFSNLNTAIAAYNAGEGKVSEWLENEEFSDDKITLKKIPYKETNNYVEKVNLNLKIYSKKFK